MTEVENRPIAYINKDGRPTYRMSAAGVCPIALGAARLGYKPLNAPDFLMRAAREGKRHEPWVIEDLKSEGWEITDRQKEVVIRKPALVLEGHIDGKAQKNGEQRLLEIKTMSKARFESFVRYGLKTEEFYTYAAQITVYHNAVKLPILYVVKCRDNGEIKILPLNGPPLDFDEIYKKFIRIERYARKGQLPNMDGCKRGSFEEFICQYKHICPVVAEEKVEGKVDKLPDALAVYADVYRQGKALEEEGKTLMNEAREKFKEEMTELGINKASQFGLSISRYDGERKSVAVKNLEKALNKHVKDKKIIDKVLKDAITVSKFPNTIRIQDLLQS